MYQRQLTATLLHNSGAETFRRLRPVDSSESYTEDAFRQRVKTIEAAARPPGIASRVRSILQIEGEIAVF
jgi:hypothetical protein